MTQMTGKRLMEMGWPQGKPLGEAKAGANWLLARGDAESSVVALLNAVLAMPERYITDPQFGEAARLLVRERQKDEPAAGVELHAEPLPYPVWGRAGIDPNAITQMDQSMRLPVTAAGALMPDAHFGYGLPIGGVLATAGAVIPWAVGVDVSCAMMVSIFPQSAHVLGQRHGALVKAIMDNTRFGTGKAWDNRTRPEHPVLDDPEWDALPILRALKDTAAGQIGTSGTGNHFTEFGDFELENADLGLEPGRYLALLSHSGSRGVGYKIADYFSKRATAARPGLPDEVKHLAWLDMDSEAGQEYWLAMQLAGRFAEANHAVIHRKVAQAAGVQAVTQIFNRHNFAWETTLPDGRTVYVHRKGATPAGAGVLGIIPGSMADPGYIVRGKGNPDSLESASHGAGRAMGRKEAMRQITPAQQAAYLAERGVTLLGGGLDEAPQAYKRIEAVIAAQADLVEIVGKFTPRIVRMADEAGEN